jgi:hypothetical protein
MRNFQSLDQVKIDAETGIIHLTYSQAKQADSQIAMRREGEYVSISASYGPLEIALRPRYDDLVRTLSRLQPIGGLQTTRQVGTGQAYLSVGLGQDKTLLIRPTLVGDATGHMSLNLSVTPDVRKQLYQWLSIEGVD